MFSFLYTIKSFSYKGNVWCILARIIGVTSIGQTLLWGCKPTLGGLPCKGRPAWVLQGSMPWVNLPTFSTRMGKKSEDEVQWSGSTQTEKYKERVLRQAAHYAENILISFKISIILPSAALKMNLKQNCYLLPLLLILTCELKQVCNLNMTFLYGIVFFFLKLI